MQRTTFKNRPFGYLSLYLLAFCTALGVTLIAYLSTSWAIAQEVSSTSPVLIQGFQHNRLISSVVDSQPMTDATTFVIGAAAPASTAVKPVEVLPPPPLVTSGSVQRVSTVLPLRTIQEDTILSPFETIKQTVPKAKNTPSTAIATVTPPISVPTEPKPVTSKDTLSLLVDKEQQRQRAVVQFLTARPNKIDVTEPKPTV
jgi:hypothetical protein